MLNALSKGKIKMSVNDPREEERKRRQESREEKRRAAEERQKATTYQECPFCHNCFSESSISHHTANCHPDNQ